MVSTVSTRPNYYEMLGLTPTATGDEIAKAFAREMGMLRVRPLGAAAVISIAYDTLRNPVKRRAYDESIGLLRKPEPRPSAIPAVRFAGSARWDPMVRPSVDLPPPAPPPPPPPAPAAEARPRPDAPFEQRLAAIAASVRDLASRGPAEVPTPPRAQPVPGPAAVAEPMLERRVPDFLALRHVEAEPSPDADGRPFEWRRAALAAGGLVLAAGLLGAWAGVAAGTDAEQQGEEAVTVAVPPAKSGPAVALAALDPGQGLAEERPERRSRAAARRAPRGAAPKPQRALSDQELEQLVPVDVSRGTNEGDAGAVAQSVAEAPSVAPAAASMPLPNKVIARTIGRIGYACGQVASTSALDGPGVFKVTCTSGHSYQATPVRGRYHFRRLGGR